jgi:hypothetical protein
VTTQSEPSTARRLVGDIAPKLAQLTDEVLFGDIWLGFHRHPARARRQDRRALDQHGPGGSSRADAPANMRLGERSRCEQLSSRHGPPRDVSGCGWGRVRRVLKVVDSVSLRGNGVPMSSNSCALAQHDRVQLVEPVLEEQRA